MAEFSNERAAQWMERYYGKMLNQFTPRIQMDIARLQPIREWALKSPDELKCQYIWGPVGSGKTIYAVFQMLDWMRACYASRLYRPEALFISAPELLLQFRATYNSGSSIQEGDIVERYGRAGLLVLDDLGVEKTTEWAYTMLYLVINRRYETMAPTIYTCNLSLAELSSRLGDDRISSRIQQSCQILHSSKNYRTR